MKYNHIGDNDRFIASVYKEVLPSYRTVAALEENQPHTDAAQNKTMIGQGVAFQRNRRLTGELERQAY